MAAFEIALAFLDDISLRRKFVFAAASFIKPKEDTNDLVKGKSILIPLIGKLFTARCVWAPHNAFAGTLISPRLSFSILYFIFTSYFDKLF